MIVREIKTNPEILDNFDWFNDYKDTRSWATRCCPEIVQKMDNGYFKHMENKQRDREGGLMDTDIFKDIEQAAKDEEKKKDGVDLGAISALVKKQAELEADANEDTANTFYEIAKRNNDSVKDLEVAAKLLKADLNQLKQRDIPELMAEYGLDSITTDTGLEVTIKGDINVTVKDQPKLLAYIRSEKSGDLIKNNLSVDIKGDEALRLDVEKYLNDKNVGYESKEGIHPGTLKVFLKRQLSEGKHPDEEIVRIYEYKSAKIK